MRHRSAASDRGARRLVIVAGALAAVLLLAIGAWTLGGRGSRVVPVVDAPGGPMRVKPENRGGMQVTGMNDPMLSGDVGKGKEALAPPPEVPEPKALQSQLEAAKPAASPPAEKPASVAPPAAPAPEPAASRPAATVQHPTLAAASARPVPPPAPAARAGDRAAAPAGNAGVQLAAVRSEEAARAEWGRLVKRIPGLLAGRHPSFVRVERDGHVFWRVRTGGFADRDEASQFCAQVRAKGRSCIVSSF